MPTTKDHVLFAANAYAASPDVVSDENVVPVPKDWDRLTRAEMNNNTGINAETGFLARAYKNATPGANEIVIAYAGTTPENMKDWPNGNLPGAPAPA